MRSRLILLFATISFSVSAQNIDIDLLQAVNVHRAKSLDPSFQFITQSASPLSVATPLVVFTAGILRNDTNLARNGIMIGGAMALSATTTLILKYTVNRPRPFETFPFIVQLSDVGSPSFPSGHTSNVFATATSLSLAFPKWYVTAPALLWASAVGYSRMHLGVHYPSDVLVGAAIGAGSAFLSHYLNRRLFRK
ncbi:MAG: phosphatase PAP2 family protein [Flavobacteriales bacterium]|nr:phosphatase PAP2 family protein [Flavobacteriales bacterium]